ncbi:MAG: hypothetical protein FJW79_05390 [Actinobacteria bacterium]|nr:hypothetical protein [Actinomycetota bacterium]
MTARPYPAARCIVTGERGAGKTALCRAVVAAARDCGPAFDLAGVLSPAVFAGESKVAIDVEDLRTGERRRLARRRSPGEGCREGEAATREWCFDGGALRWGGEVLAAATPCRLLVFDEAGPLEFERGEGWVAGLEAVDGGRFAAALVVVRPHLVAVARRRWPGAEVVEVADPAAAAAAAAVLVPRLVGEPGLR